MYRNYELYRRPKINIEKIFPGIWQSLTVERRPETELKAGNRMAEFNIDYM